MSRSPSIAASGADDQHLEARDSEEKDELESGAQEDASRDDGKIELDSAGQSKDAQEPRAHTRKGRSMQAYVADSSDNEEDGQLDSTSGRTRRAKKARAGKRSANAPSTDEDVDGDSEEAEDDSDENETEQDVYSEIIDESDQREEDDESDEDDSEQIDARPEVLVKYHPVLAAGWTMHDVCRLQLVRCCDLS